MIIGCQLFPFYWACDRNKLAFLLKILLVVHDLVIWGGGIDPTSGSDFGLTGQEGWETVC